MDYTLVIDQGNTASKATVFHYDKVVEIFRYETLTIEGLCPVFEQYDIKVNAQEIELVGIFGGALVEPKSASYLA